MILISHRGNVIGADPNRENSPDYIDEALALGIWCEIDLRIKDGGLYLGHDYAQYPISAEFLAKRQNSLWVHCKDYKALQWALSNKLHCFWHQEDDYTITSQQYIWVYPGKSVPHDWQSVIVMPEQHMTIEEIKTLEIYGICSDIPGLIKDLRSTTDEND